MSYVGEAELRRFTNHAVQKSGAADDATQMSAAPLTISFVSIRRLECVDAGGPHIDIHTRILAAHDESDVVRHFCRELVRERTSVSISAPNHDAAQTLDTICE